jgi:ribose/xylose/arabinose/galactoside ABC-type transport system permease subunit
MKQPARNEAAEDKAVKNLTSRNGSSLGQLRRFGLWIVLIVVVVVLSIASPTFRDPINLENILDQNAIIGIVACGMTIMMISGGFDLSVGAVGATSSIVAAVAIQAGLGTLVAIIAGLLSGLIVGLINGLLIARVGINAFVTTFAMASVVSGLLFVATNANSTTTNSPELIWAAQAGLGPIPVAFVLFLVCLVIVWVILTRTKFGHYIYSVGGNAEASNLSGVPVRRVQMLAFALGGVFAAAGGIMLLGQVGTAQPSAAGDWPLQAIAICVVGGIALTGGVGRIEDVLAATLLLGVVADGIDQLGIDSYWKPAVSGLVILVAVILDQYNRRRARSRPAQQTSLPATDSNVVPAVEREGASPLRNSPASQ